jgi:hypothetical protein
MRTREAAIALVALVALAACDNRYDGPDPTGTHTSAGPVIVQYDPRPPGVPFDAQMPNVAKVAKESGDVYKVTFGACSVRVKRPRVPPSWKVIDAPPCQTSMGPVTITGGDMTVIEEGRMRFSFEGKTSDGKTNVKFVFAGGVKS